MKFAMKYEDNSLDQYTYAYGLAQAIMESVGSELMGKNGLHKNPGAIPVEVWHTVPSMQALRKCYEKLHDELLTRGKLDDYQYQLNELLRLIDTVSGYYMEHIKDDMPISSLPYTRLNAYAHGMTVMSRKSPIRRCREAAGVTSQELADKSGVRQATISDVENGKSVPSSDTLRKMADALDCTMDELWPRNDS
jgi:DNA-binding XRE family transcriptional regulator